MTRSRVTLRITTDGRIQGLWTDEVALAELGKLQVQRASHVEFDDRRQCWTVRTATSSGLIPRWMHRFLGRPISHTLHEASTRASALAWEHEYFQPGGPGWPS